MLSMGVRPLYNFNSFIAGIDFRRQNLTSVDVRFWRLKSILAIEWLKNSILISSEIFWILISRVEILKIIRIVWMNEWMNDWMKSYIAHVSSRSAEHWE